MAIYGLHPNVQGNVTAEGYANHFRVESLHFGIGRAVSMEAGNLANRESTRPNFSEVTLTKKADNSLTAFFQEAVTGSGGNTMKFVFVQTGTEGVSEYMDYELENAIISAYSVSADSEGDPIETISISYSKIMVNYSDHDTTNTNANPQRVGYNLETAAPV